MTQKLSDSVVIDDPAAIRLAEQARKDLEASGIQISLAECLAAMALFAAARNVEELRGNRGMPLMDVPLIVPDENGVPLRGEALYEALRSRFAAEIARRMGRAEHILKTINAPIDSEESGGGTAPLLN